MEEGRKLKCGIPCHGALYTKSIYWLKRNLNKFKEDIYWESLLIYRNHLRKLLNWKSLLANSIREKYHIEAKSKDTVLCASGFLFTVRDRALAGWSGLLVCVQLFLHPCVLLEVDWPGCPGNLSDLTAIPILTQLPYKLNDNVLIHVKHYTKFHV